MTREKILQIARKAGSLIEAAQEKDLLWLERYTELAIAEEREACALMVDEYIKETDDILARGCLASVAYDIRARSKK